jgi:hypothetical protein
MTRHQKQVNSTLLLYLFQILNIASRNGEKNCEKVAEKFDEKNKQKQLKMLVSATILKFSTGSSSGSTGTLSNSSQSGSGCSGNILTLNPLPWECDKFSPVKLESPDTNLDDIVLDQSASSDFAELKPLPYDDYGTATALTGGMDPVLSAHNNNNNSSLSKCLGSPASSLQVPKL